MRDETLVNEVVLRSQAQAVYAAENFGHFGLNLRRYAHFTSPIRRYADLVVHRGLIRAGKLGDGGLAESIDKATLGEIAATISVAERRAAMAAVKTIRYTENGPTFELHGKLEALAQLRDMHGFKGASKMELTGANGGPLVPIINLTGRPEPSPAS